MNLIYKVFLIVLIIFLSSCQNKKNESHLTEWEVLKEVIDSPYDGYTEQKKKIFSMHDMIDASRQLR